MTDVMVLLIGKGDFYPFADYLKNYEEKSNGAVKPEIFNLISSQPLLLNFKKEDHYLYFVHIPVLLF